MKENFEIIAIHILRDCPEYIRKVLEEDKWYFFSKKYKEVEGKLVINKSYSIPENFYSSKINIQAVVGKNGSGKSSVIEVMLRLINNLASDLISTAKTDTKLYFVNDIKAELFYEVNGHINSIKCIGNKVYLDQGNGYDISVDEYIDVNKAAIQYNLSEQTSINLAIPLLQKFFFTIVNNYSFHAYNAFDFQEEFEDREHVWLNGLFHKNDGYLTPLVLNPFRDSGKINMAREKNLTNSRLASLFYRFKKERIDFIPDYEFQFLTFNLNPDHVKNKYKYYPIRKGVLLKKEKEKVVKIKNKKTDNFNTTLNYYYETIVDDKRLEQAYKYLVYKTYSISEKYPNYSSYIKISLNQYGDYCRVSSKPKIKELVDKIRRDSSHTTLKIRQTLKYIDYVLNHNTDLYQKTLDEDYIDYIPHDSSLYKGLTVSDRLVASFPPPFYEAAIYLKTPKEQSITFEKMSSGERQFLFYMSTLLYHLKNLDSVVNDDESVHYKYVNIILEEVELYFHPEYQRQFISRLIKYLEASNFKNLAYFNIIIATHSPFILSDIPQDNIMFLDNGNQVNDSVCMATFGANIYEMLKHSFFLKDGSMGAFAVDKINDTINYLNMKLLESELSNIESSNSNYELKVEQLKELKQKIKEFDIDKHRALIELVDEPIIKTKLVEMYEEVASEGEQIEILEKRIADMQNKLISMKNRK